MVEPAKNSIWIYLIPLWQLEQVSSTFGRRGVEVSLTSHSGLRVRPVNGISRKSIDRLDDSAYTIKAVV